MKFDELPKDYQDAFFYYRHNGQQPGFDCGFEAGRASCAASPWHYRTDTGDKYGKVIESAELPEANKTKQFLFMVKWMPNKEIIIFVGSFSGGRSWFIAGNVLQDEMKTEIVAWAELNTGEECQNER